MNPEWDVKNYDLVILPPADTFKEFLIGLIFAVLCKMYKKKCIYWTEHWEAPVKEQSFLRFGFNITKHIEIGILSRLADKCIASGTKASEFYRSIGIKDDKIEVAIDSSTSPQSTETVNFRATYGIPDTDEVILYFGRIVERKGLNFLLKAYKAMEKKNKWLIVCGEGAFLPTAKKYVEENNLSHVIFTGKIQPKTRKSYYERADVFVLPSYPRKGSVEIWGLTVNEALEAGTPVVATNAVGAAYDLLDGKNGIMVEHSSAVKLKEAIEKYVNKDMFKENCKETANRYSVHNMAQTFADCIDNCVDAN